MLYLNPPFHIINGVSLFSDHADPLQYYYLPIAPKLAELEDPVTKSLVPQIQIIKFKGSAGNGGFLNFDVNLAVKPDALEDIRGEIKLLARLRDQPRLAPVPLVDGTVQMMLFGKQTGDTNDPNNPSPFVIKIDQAAKPSLYGDNQAAFSVMLDQRGVTILDKAIAGELSPIGIVYTLEYLALRPAYSVRLNVNWEQVQKHLSENYGVDGIFVSTQIEKTVDELIENKTIDLQVDTFVPEGEDTAGIIGSKEQASNEVKDMITDAFFKPSLDPVKEEVDGWDKALHVAERAGAIAATGGWGGIAKFSYKNIDYTRIDKKTLNVNMSERTTIKRSIYPQGHLSGLFRTLRDSGVALDRFIISVDTDDPWFDRRKLKVISRADFAADSIGSLNVQMRYKSEPKNVILDSTTPTGDVSWSSVITNGAMEREIVASYKVNFKGVDGTERPVSLTSPEQKVDVDNLEIDPRELYSIVSVPVIALAFPWKRYPNVEVQTRYMDEANNVRVADSFILSEEKAEDVWKMFVRNPAHTKFSYKLIFRAADHKDVTMPWVETDAEQVVVRDPYPRKRTVSVVPNFSWATIDRAFVDLSYQDKANNINESKSLEFSELASESQNFTIDLVNPDVRRVGFQTTILYKDGRMNEIPHSFTHADRIFIRDNMKGHKIILIRPAPVDFAVKKIKEVTVETRYVDDAAGIDDAEIFAFKSSGEQAQFEFDYVDEAKADFEYRAKYRFTNGMSRSIDWVKTSVDDLVVPLV